MRAALAELWRYRAMVGPLLLARVFVWIADTATLTWAAPTFARRFGLAPHRVGAVLAAALLVAGLSGPILAGTLSDICQRFGGPRRTMQALSGVALLMLSAGMFAVMPGSLPASTLLIIFLTAGFTISTTAMTVATIVIPNEVRGLYMSLSLMVGMLIALGFAPMAVSGLSSAMGGAAKIGPALTLVCLVASLLGAITFATASPYFPRRAT